VLAHVAGLVNAVKQHVNVGIVNPCLKKKHKTFLKKRKQKPKLKKMSRSLKLIRLKII